MKLKYRAVALALPAILLLSSWMTLDLKKNPGFPKHFDDHFAAVPGMAYTMVMDCDTCTHNRTVMVEGFYCATTEVSNFMYREFLTDLKRAGETEKLALAQVDSLQWRTPMGYNEPFVEYYFNHPAYNDYPVVNVSHEGAELYCAWLQDSLNAFADGQVKYTVTLPTRDEWVAAAKGGHEFATYAWGGPYLRNAKGCFLANFRYLGAGNIHYNSETGEYEVLTSVPGPMLGHPGATLGEIGKKNQECFISAYQLTAPVSSFTKNDFGLYNMNGNVAEMVAEKGIACGGGWKSTGYDVRCESTMPNDGPQTDVGFRPIIRVDRR
ncbi:SUMF1/EgtB/PvdO family nonheme iron enzyme [Sanyastnella coralliicola]|uniref:SUMF1/EgtB/PvdO family nonheme iron enzyme n=1 Tax=Sanyastnella coralliicola TaxID=3069118 RepID=UPI0027B8CB8E|nr:SUMF1/EgtB/PvdO family nonheme iron enzyme [Longitalea sp. SCSIO 12813]